MKQLKHDGRLPFYGTDGRGVYYQKIKGGDKFFVYGPSDLYEYVSEEEWDEYFEEDNE